MSLDTPVYLYRLPEQGPTPLPREALDAMVARLPEDAQRRRIADRGVVRCAYDDLNWLLVGGGAERLDPPASATLQCVRRFDEAPHLVRPLDVVRRYVAAGWVPESQLAHLPPEALEPPHEEPGVGLDSVLAKMFPDMGIEPWPGLRVVVASTSVPLPEKDTVTEWRMAARRTGQA